ncbi:replication-relaxation family protein [Streptacidiphilus sp. EB129]|uniref:replication-relaxation family protein n=1 Tax=Streptacidiphilus sp. EB129 TaxID=3156262 RepID=UPI0035139D10
MADTTSRPRRSRYNPDAPNPHHSTAVVRGRVLAALGVLTLATADTLWQLVQPTDRSDKAVRNALLDLRGPLPTTGQLPKGLTWSDGNTRERNARAIWRLTPRGQRAALAELPPGTELGGTGEGAARSGAQHAMAVNQVVLAFHRAGLAQVHQWRTEVLHVTSTKRRIITDAVLRAPEAGLPMLFVEVDRNTMSAVDVAAKFTAYLEYFNSTGKDSEDRTRPLWFLRYGKKANEGHPPVALVFGGGGPVALANGMQRVQELSRATWRPRHFKGEAWRDYDETIPIIATTQKLLAEQGADGEVWRRFGRDRLQTLQEALWNPDGEALRAQLAREAEEQRKAEQLQRDQEQQERARISRARREAQRQCAGCGKTFLPSWFDEATGTGEEPWTAEDCAPCTKARQQQALQDAAAEAAATRRRGLLRNRR